MSFHMNWEKMEEIIPAIVQNIHTREVLMLGYMNQEALQKTLETNKVTFYSRSKKRLWTKGESSAHYLNLREIQVDCDQDALLILVDPEGPTCHQGSNSCFTRQFEILNDLYLLLKQRRQNPVKGSYTSELLNSGTQRIAQKVGEEGLEVALEAMTGNKEKLNEEIADLVFHLMVLMEDQGIEFHDVLNVLAKRKK